MSGLAGEHRLYGVGSNGCAGVWHIEIPRDTIPPFLLVESDTLSCQDTVHILSQSLDSVVAYAWSGPGIINTMGSAIDVNLPGTYMLAATGVNGCIAMYSIHVDSNYILPAVELMHDSLRCDQPATLTASSVDPSVQFIWYDDGGQVLTMDSFVQVTQPGQYIVQSQGANKCAAYDTITLFPLVFPTVTLETDTITCVIQQVTIQSTFDVVPTDWYWLNAIGDTIPATATIDVTDAGPYIFSVTGPNGCITNDTITVPVDTIAPDAEITLTGEIRCKDRDVMFSGEMSSPGSISYLWSTTGGNIVSDITQPEIDARDTGVYFLTVTNLMNGCDNTDSFHLLPNPQDITGVVLSITRTMCSGDLNGAFEVTSVMGGIGPFLYQLPPAPPQLASSFDGLGEGQHMVVITDAAGCEYDTLVEILSTPDYTVDAGEDTEIYLGESVFLIGSSDLVASEIAVSYWDSLGTQLCTPCDVLEVSPWETATYTFTVESATGCVRSDDVIVYVLERARYFIPNIFSPNGDGINDEIRIHPGPGIARVLQWIIFDRWGNAVYGATDFDPADTSVYWDGVTSTGETANPAVFPYLLEVQLINGGREIYHGDITLIR
jgi:hypothetical protein